MTKQQESLINEINENGGLLTFTTVEYNIDCSYVKNARRARAMFELEDAGLLEIVKDHWHGKSRGATGTLSTYTYTVKMKEGK